MTRRMLATGCLLAILSCGMIPPIANAQAQVKIPPPNVQLMLIRNSLTALNHAMISGNFTVLRELASDRFRNQYKSAELSQVFQNLTANKIDLSPVLIHNPQLSGAPQLTADGRMRLAGHFATKPLAVRFDLVFQYGPKGWGIDDIGVALAQVPAAVAPASFQQPATRPIDPQAGQGASHGQPAGVVQPAVYAQPVGYNQPAQPVYNPRPLGFVQNGPYQAPRSSASPTGYAKLTDYPQHSQPAAGAQSLNNPGTTRPATYLQATAAQQPAAALPSGPYPNPATFAPPPSAAQPNAYQPPQPETQRTGYAKPALFDPR